MNKTIKDTASWTKQELIEGIVRQDATLLNCRLALNDLTSTPLSSGGRDPRLNILALAGDSLRRTALLQKEALSRGMKGNLDAMKAEGFRLGDEDGFFKGWAAKLIYKGEGE